ncbi:DUF177 domain-containing protein [Selenomonas sp. oral taxon 478]|uniref:YceD family protein n=1 Tax=Selenomonas sp. oral taxon 478 TaxID=712538 RepID=UPI00067A3149|nr:DUF177 domain-containing protein [Selenomonas sp. oral taxon 478]AKT53050.1 hypothetical protein ADJ74_00525 [Selenomonas sp. oral taxon 478]
MMKLDVAALASAPGESREFTFSVTPESLDLGDSTVAYRGAVHVEGTVMDTGTSFRIVGTVRAVRAFVCDRCLAESERENTYDFSEDYAKTPGEADETEGYDGETIVLDPLVRDTLLVAEPLRELCKSDCKGLCPVCGQNLNEGTCTCNTFVPDPRLAALESLLKND